MLMFDPNSGEIRFRGKVIGSISHKNGKTLVEFNMIYEAGDDWIVPLSYLRYGLREVGIAERHPTILFVQSSNDEVYALPDPGPALLIEKELKQGWYVWTFHKSNADSWPSPLHGHDYERGLTINGIDGNIYDSATRTLVKTLKTKTLQRLHENIWKCKDLEALAYQHLQPPPAPPAP